jgi:glycosyltransferase involved in cell wall biosynthesis
VQDVFPEIAAREIFWLRGPPGWALKWMRNAVLRRASFIVVLSGAMRRHLIAEGIAEDKFFVIPNWSDGATVSPLAAEDNPLRGSWSLRDKFVIGYSGNLGRVHDGQTFLDAAALLESDPAMVFLFIGGGAKRKEIEDRVRRSGVANVQFKPYQAQGILNQSLALPDVHLVSLRPGFEDLVYPSKIAGASAAGRPIIFVGDTDGDLARTILDARAGFVVSCGDGGGLAKRLRELKSDAALGREMGENARNLHEKKFARHQALAAWMELLRRRQM